MAANSAALSKFTFATVDVPAVGTVSVSNSRPPIDVTSIGAAKSYFLHGVMSTTVALDVYFNSADHGTISTALTSASSANAFIVTLASGVTISGNGLVVQNDIVASAGDVVRASIVIQATGDVTVLGTANFDGAMD